MQHLCEVSRREEEMSVSRARDDLVRGREVEEDKIRDIYLEKVGFTINKVYLFIKPEYINRGLTIHKVIHR